VRKASSASPIHHSAFTIHNSDPFLTLDFCPCNRGRRNRDTKGDDAPHCTRTSRRVSEKRDSAATYLLLPSGFSLLSVVAIPARTANHAALAGMCKLKSKKLCTSMPQHPMAAPNRIQLA